VADHVTPAVVAIRTRRSHGEGDSPMEDMFRQFFPRERDFRGPGFDSPGAGSGFVVSADGYVVTNNHVIEGADEIIVKLPGIEPLEATLVGQDPPTDLAVLKIDADREFQYLEFGDSDEIKVGDWAIAIGNPLGQLEGSLTVGVVSAKGRADLVIQGAQLRYQDFIQTDAAINPGNSGGPLVNIRGDVIGVNTAINRAGQGIGFAIPARLTERIYAQLVEHGRVRRGYLGIVMGTLSPEESAGLDLDIRDAVYVQELRDGTPADIAGIEEGDVLLEFNGRPINSIRELSFMVADAEVGSTATILVNRSGQTLEVDVVLAEYDEGAVFASVPAPSPTDWLGLSVAPLEGGFDSRVEELRDRYDIQDTEGVIITEVTSGSPADQARLRPGDVIVEIVNAPINDLNDFLATAERLRDRDKPIAILIRRGGMTSYMTVDPTIGGRDGSEN